MTEPTHTGILSWRLALLLLAVATALALGGRMLAPSDIYDNEQPKTMAYTADVVLHGRAILPRDTSGGAPHKPPLYNWVGAPLPALGVWSEWALKMPSILAGLATMALTAGAGAWLLRRGRRSETPVAAEAPAALSPAVFGMVAAGIWLANHAGVKLIYLARPDMLMVALLTAGWLLGTRLLLDEVGRRDASVAPRRGLAQLGLWLCVGGAAMCKGPPALVLPLYLLVAARLIVGRWAAVHRTGIGWGLPLAVAMVGAWLGAAYLIDRAAVMEQLIGDQAVGKLHRRGWHRIFTEIYKPITYFISRFVPWSLVMVLTLIHVPPRRWFKHPTGPMTLWVLVVIVFFMIPADRRPDYVAPAYPAAAVLAAYWLTVVAAKHGLRPRHAMVGVIAMVFILIVYHMQFSRPARSGLGDNVKAFAHGVRELTGAEGLVFRDSGYNALQPLLGYNQAGPPTEADLRRGRWLIQPVAAGERAMLVSPPMPGMRPGVMPGIEAGANDRLGVYRLEGVGERQ